MHRAAMRTTSRLTFNYTARDFDGDTATGSFIVAVDDDVPVQAGGEQRAPFWLRSRKTACR